MYVCMCVCFMYVCTRACVCVHFMRVHERVYVCIYVWVNTRFFNKYNL